jgi:hypothetical protein
MKNANSREIGLVSCVKSKQENAAIPKNLYTSDYFHKMRRYAEQTHDEWWILSAKHGLLNPDGDPINPYDDTLTGASVTRKREWAKQVVSELREAGILDGNTHLVIHAGKSYYGELLPLLGDSDVAEITIPTEGLAIGETLAWYKERL